MKWMKESCNIFFDLLLVSREAVSNITLKCQHH